MIRVGTIGTSVITESFARAVRATSGIRIAAVSSRDDERAREFAATVDSPLAFGGVDLMQRSGEVDAVYIGSPNAAHAAQVRDALDAGLHVFVEKPAVGTASEWDELTARADRAGVVLLEAMRTAYDPGIHVLSAELPALGRLRRASLHYQKRSSRYDDVLDGGMPNIFDPQMGGGAFADLGVYGIHAAILLFGEPRAVAGAFVPIPTGADGAGIALLEYDGLVVDVSFSKITSSTRPSEIQGEDATMLIDHLASPRELVIRDHRGAERRIGIDGPQDGMADEVARFVRAVAGSEPARPDQERTAATLRTMERIRAALIG